MGIFMGSVARMPLEGGGAVLFEAGPAELGEAGLVKAGHVADAVRELPRTLQNALAPVRETARVVLEQLRESGPTEVEVEFGVDLSAEAGVVVTRAQSACHVKVRLLWSREEDIEGTR
ncbi:CU044_2847 family protein [Streptomyces mayteni]